MKHAKKIVRCSREVIVRGIVLTPWEPRRATLELVVRSGQVLELVVSTPRGRV